MVFSFYCRACIFLGILTITICRRYDVEKEAIRLYGMDLNSVLEQFRKTPEYFKILRNRIETIKKRTNSLFMDISYVYNRKLVNKLNEMITGKKIGNSESLRSGFPVYDGEKRKLRTNSNLTSVQFLEKYYKLHPKLTLKQKTKLINLAFEHVGLAIHTLIKSCTPDGTPPISTQQPYWGETTHTTSVEHTHVVTKDENESPAPEDAATSRQPEALVTKYEPGSEDELDAKKKLRLHKKKKTKY